MGSHLPFYGAAFVIALAILIVVHELGHFLVARWCGVKVLRFSIGFGKVLMMRRFGVDQTEWAVAAFPLGGFVKMLDEREGPVAPEELPRAFNRQPVSRRFMIVAAGPLANLILAIFLYWLLFMQGTEELRPVLAAPEAATPAAMAAFQAGDTVQRVNGKPVVTWQEMRWELTQVALDHEPVRLEIENLQKEIHQRALATESLDESDLEKDIPGRLGLKPYMPKLKPVVGEVTQGSVAAQAGLQVGDEIVSIESEPVTAWRDVVTRVRAAAGRPLWVEFRRGAQVLKVQLTPETTHDGGQRVGRLGVVVKDDPALYAMLFATIQYDPLQALGKAVKQTWETASFSLKMMGRMLVGELSWRNLSGPVTIADYAGKSASMGWKPYLTFIALISISLGVLNLLPIPILDGGHLLYYIVEIFKGSPLSERVMEIGQQIGLTLLLKLMAFAFYNDINRLISG
ncbi:MAG: RIP metalloprotease RseP [Sterolibacterium sp.]|nr:RIP metalloprotease RseP [Sterolibacterium sp.]